MNRFYVYRPGEAGDTFDADSEPDSKGKWMKSSEVDKLHELILSNLREIIRACPNTYAVYVATLTIKKMGETK